MADAVFNAIKLEISRLNLNDHSFYHEFRKGPWPKETLRKIFQEYYYYIRTFPQILAGLTSRVESESVRVQLAKTIVSELGAGHGPAHFEMFEKVLDACDVKLSPYDKVNYLPTTVNLVEGLRSLFNVDSPDAAVGGHFTIEETGLMMIHHLYEGFRHYPEIDVQAMEYFHLHLFLESAHVDWISRAVEDRAKDVTRQQDLIRGGIVVANLLNEFWLGLKGVLIAFNSEVEEDAESIAC